MDWLGFDFFPSTKTRRIFMAFESCLIHFRQFNTTTYKHRAVDPIYMRSDLRKDVILGIVKLKPFSFLTNVECVEWEWTNKSNVTACFYSDSPFFLFKKLSPDRWNESTTDNFFYDEKAHYINTTDMYKKKKTQPIVFILYQHIQLVVLLDR